MGLQIIKEDIIFIAVALLHRKSLLLFPLHILTSNSKYVHGIINVVLTCNLNNTM